MHRGRGRGGGHSMGGRGRRPSASGPSTRGRGGGAGPTSKGGGGGPSAKGGGSQKSANTSHSQSNSQTAVVNQVLTPVVKPLYPPAGKPNPLDAHLSSLVPVLLEMTQYFKSNYSIPIPKGKFQSPFQVPRYSDRYNEPLSIDPHLLHKPDDKRLPTELLTKGITRTHAKRPEFNMIKKLQELSNKAAAEEAEGDIEEIDLASDDDDGPKSTMIKREPKVEKEEEKPVEDDDDEEEEMDEELDAGTDYLANYFDNGEDYLDDDEDSVDDSAVY